jgi:Type II secretion system (T2SS), protein E, N-terminal domain
MTLLAGAPTQGLVEPSSPDGRSAFLSEVVVEMGFAAEEAVERAMEQARNEGHTFAVVALETGTLDEGQLARAIAERHGLAYADLDEFEVDPTAVRLISRAAAKRYRGVPISFCADGSLLVALEDPVDALAVNDIAVMTRTDVQPVVATRSAIEALIATIPDEVPASFNGHPGDPVEAAAPPSDEEPYAPEEPALPPDPSPPPGAEPSWPTERPLAEPATQAPFPAPCPPEPAGEGNEDPSPRLQEKIASLIERALDGVAETGVAELEGELESARAEIAELAAELDAARREQAQHAEREQALRAQISASQRAGGKLKQALSNLLLAASEAQSAADELEDELSDSPPR